MHRPSVSSLLGAVDVLLETGHRELTVDLSEAEEIVEAAVRAIAALQHDLWAHSGAFKVANASPPVADQLVVGQVMSPRAI